MLRIVAAQASDDLKLQGVSYCEMVVPAICGKGEMKPLDGLGALNFARNRSAEGALRSQVGLKDLEETASCVTSVTAAGPHQLI